MRLEDFLKLSKMLAFLLAIVVSNLETVKFTAWLTAPKSFMSDSNRR